MIRRVVFAALLCTAAPVHAQPRATVDSLVSRITRSWGSAPRGGWCAHWSVVRGDSTALNAATAEISGNDRFGMYTITVRRERFAAPVLVGRLRVGYEHADAIAARPIARGSLIDSADVLLQHTVMWGAPVSEPTVTLASVIGSQARRTVHDGDVIRPTDIASAPVVFAGDSVTAELFRDGVRLALVGTALHNASLGERVAIRFGRGRQFAGLATGRHTVRLD